MAKYRFEQIAFNSTEKKIPNDHDRLLYIGLEHLDSGSLRVTRWGSDVPIKGEKLVMHKGDVLFGKRNAYLRRAAIAPHDGTFSAHGMVLRPNEQIVCKEFFPHFIASDYFFDEAIRISVGSLSPTVNWKDLRNCEFELPSLEEQKRLAKALWAVNYTIETYKNLLKKTDELVKSQFMEMFGDPTTNPMDWEIKPLYEVAEYFIGLTYRPSDIAEQGTIVLRSGNIQDSKLDFGDVVRVNLEVRKQLYVHENDILMCSRNGSADLVGKVAKIPKMTENMTFGAFMTIIRTVYHDYIFSYFQTDAFRSQINTGKTATINQITEAMLDKVILPLPPLPLQQQFAAFVRQTDKSKLFIQRAKELILPQGCRRMRTPLK